MYRSSAHISEVPNQRNQLVWSQGQQYNNLALVCSYTVREYVLDPLKEAGVDSELIGYAQKVTNLPTFQNSFNRAL